MVEMGGEGGDPACADPMRGRKGRRTATSPHTCITHMRMHMHIHMLWVRMGGSPRQRGSKAVTNVTVASVRLSILVSSCGVRRA